MDNDPYQYDESNMRMIETTEVTNELTKSILKPPKIRAPLQEVDLAPCYSVTELDTIRKRRVSFAGVNKIKEFYSKAESAIIFSTPAYEETFSMSSDSSLCPSSFGGSIIHGEMSSSDMPCSHADDSDCALLNDTMDLTDPLPGLYLKNETTIEAIEETDIKENSFFQKTPCSDLLVDKRENASDSSVNSFSKESVSLENISVPEELLKNIEKLTQDDLVIDLGSAFKSNPMNNSSECADTVFESKKAKKRKSCKIDESEPWLAFREEMNKTSQDDDIFSSIPKNSETSLDNFCCSGPRKIDDVYRRSDDGLDIPGNRSEDPTDLLSVTLTEAIPGVRITDSEEHSGTPGTFVRSNVPQHKNVRAYYCIDNTSMEMTEAIPENKICLLQEKIETKGYVDFRNKLTNNVVPTYECLLNSPCDEMSLTEAIPANKLIGSHENYGKLDKNNKPQGNVSAYFCNDSTSMEMTEAIPTNKIGLLQEKIETKCYVDSRGKLTKNDISTDECPVNSPCYVSQMSLTEAIPVRKIIGSHEDSGQLVENNVAEGNYCADFYDNTSMEMTEAIPKNNICVLLKNVDTKGFSGNFNKTDDTKDERLINSSSYKMSLTEAIPVRKIIGSHEDSGQLVEKNVAEGNYCADFYDNASMEMTEAIPKNNNCVLLKNVDTKGFSGNLNKTDDTKDERLLNSSSYKMSLTEAIPVSNTAGSHENFAQLENNVPQGNFCTDFCYNTSMEMTINSPSYVSSMRLSKAIPENKTTGSHEKSGQLVENNVSNGNVSAEFRSDNTTRETTEAIPKNKIFVMQEKMETECFVDFPKKCTKNNVRKDECLINSSSDKMSWTETIPVNKTTGSYENFGQLVKNNVSTSNVYADFGNNTSMEMTEAIPYNGINVLQEKMETKSFMNFPNKVNKNQVPTDECFINSPGYVTQIRLSEAIPVSRITGSHENFVQLVENKVSQDNVHADFCYDNTSMEMTEAIPKNKICVLQGKMEEKDFEDSPNKLTKNDIRRDECHINSPSYVSSESIPVNKTTGSPETFGQLVESNVPQETFSASFCNDTSMEMTEAIPKNKICVLQDRQRFMVVLNKLTNEVPSDESLINSPGYVSPMRLSEAIPANKITGSHEKCGQLVENNVRNGNVSAEFCSDNTTKETTEAIPKNEICVLQEKMETECFVDFPKKCTKNNVRKDECLINSPSYISKIRLIEASKITGQNYSRENSGQVIVNNVHKGNVLADFCNNTSMEMTEAIPKNNICVSVEKVETKSFMDFSNKLTKNDVLTDECIINSSRCVSQMRFTEAIPVSKITGSLDNSGQLVDNKVHQGNICADFCNNTSLEMTEAIPKNQNCVLQEKMESNSFLDFPNKLTKNDISTDEFLFNSPSCVSQMMLTEASKITVSHKDTEQLTENDVAKDNLAHLGSDNTSMGTAEAIRKSELCVLQERMGKKCFVDFPNQLTKNEVPTDECLINSPSYGSPVRLTESISVSKITGSHENVGQLVENRVGNVCNNTSMEMTEVIPKNKICDLQEKMETISFMDFPNKLTKNVIRTEECLINSQSYVPQMRLTESIPVSKMTGPVETLSRNLNHIQSAKKNGNGVNQTLGKQEKEEEELWGITKFNSSFFSELGFKFVGPFHWVHALPLSMELIIEIPRKKVDMRTGIKNVSIKFEEEYNRPGLNYTRDILKQKFTSFLTSTMKSSKTIQYLIIAMKIIKDEFNLLSPFIESLIFFDERYEFEIISGCLEFTLSNISSWKQFKVSIDISKLKISGKNVKIISIIGDPISEAAVQEIFDNITPTKRKLFQFLLELRKL